MIKEYQILASGIDSLDISIDVKWSNGLFFEYLAQQKFEAEEDQDKVIKFPGSDQIALIKPYGRNGHEWVIENEHFSLTIGNWLEPKSRPSIMMSMRSLALWQIGPQELTAQICSHITKSGGEILSIKPSRIDLCVDIVIPKPIWSVELIPSRVTRAAYAAPHFFNCDLTGMSIGKGKISARLYDKPLEIRQKSKKYWMYDIWEITPDLPDNLNIIRIEGQIRREGLKELGLDQLDETFSHVEKIWAYFTQDWLKFQDNPGNHHTMRTTFDWWQVIQNGFMGVQSPTPLIRCKAFNQSKKQLYSQTHGTLTSIIALNHEINDFPLGHPTGFEDMKDQLGACFTEYGKSDFDLEVAVYEKRAKNHKAKDKAEKVHQERIDKGLPCNITPEIDSKKEQN